MRRAIRLLLVDDHAVVLAGYRSLLEQVAGVEIVGEASSGEAAYQLFCEIAPDAVVMDIALPGLSGLEITRRIIARSPDARILIFSMHEEGVFVDQALQAGALGYIPKSSDPAILIDAIEAVAAGSEFLPACVAARRTRHLETPGAAALDDFSTREFEIFYLLAEGLTTATIAQRLCLSSKTVANYSTQIKAKLQIRNQAELVHFAIKKGLIVPPGPQ
jgi:DNA-binding NarL/FixJ family response regulator